MIKNTTISPKHQKIINKSKLYSILVAITLCSCNSLFSNALASETSATIEDSFKLKQDQINEIEKESINQQEFLERQSFVARESQDIELENYALTKLKLIKGQNSPSFRLMLIRSHLRLGSKPRKSIEEDVKQLCKDVPGTFECEQAQAIYDLYAPDMRLKLQVFNMHETNGDYENAVKDIEEIFEGSVPKEEGLRFRYFSLMGNINGRQAEAIAGLKQLQKEDPKNVYLNKQIDELSHAYKANMLAYEGLKNIHDPQKYNLAKKYLEDAIRMQPESNKAKYWSKRLSELNYWNLVDEGDRFAAKNQCTSAIKKYEEASKSLPSSPYSYIGILKCAVQEDNTNLFNQYADKAIQASKNEGTAEQRRIVAQISGLRGDMLINASKKASEKGDYQLAEKYLVDAMKYSNANPWYLYSLAKLKVSQKDFNEGNALFTKLGKPKLRTKDFAYPYAVFLNENGKRQEALEYLETHKSDKEYQKLISEIKNDIEVDKYQELADIEYNNGNYLESLELRKKAAKLKNNDPWILYGIAKDYIKLNDKENALSVFSSLPQKLKTEYSYAYPYSLILSALSEPEMALATLTPYQDKDSETDKAIARFKEECVVLKARNIYQKELIKNKDDINKFLDDENLQNSNLVKLELASLFYADKKYSIAQDLFEDVVETSKEEIPVTYKIRLAECYSQSNNLKLYPLTSELSKNLDYDKNKELSLYETTSIAKLCSEVDNDICSKNAYIYGTKYLEDHKIDKEEKAEFLRDIALYEKDNNQNVEVYMPKLKKAWLTLEDLEDSLDNEAITRSLLTKDSYAYLNEGKNVPQEQIDSEPWYHSSIRKALDKEYHYQNHIITTGVILLRDPGHSGYSDLYAQDYITKYNTGMYGGLFTLQTDVIHMNPGSLSYANEVDMFGSCYTPGCKGERQSKYRETFAIGWQNDKVNFDIGTAPKINNSGSVKTTDLVGSIEYTDFGLSIKAYRRAVRNSFLSFFGSVDPSSGTAFGAVKRNGIQLSSSVSFNEHSGLWGNARYEVLLGKNVDQNSDYRFMLGYYNHLIDLPNRVITIGPSITWMQYRRDLSGYTFTPKGLRQGGYYSPLQYLSTGLSISWKERTEDFSWMLQTGISGSYTKTISRYYPKCKDEYNKCIDSKTENPYQTSKNNLGVGAYLKGNLEYRINSHLVLGSAFTLEKSEDYSPNQFEFYFRWYTDEWNGDLPMPPSPPTIYPEW